MDYKKLVVAVVGAVVFGLQGALSDNSLSTVELIGLIAMVLTAFGTWIVPNTSVLAAAKTWLAALVVGSGVLVPALADGWQFNGDFWPVVISILTAAGVYMAPDAPKFIVEGKVGSR
jgi:hypothetical protein